MFCLSIFRSMLEIFIPFCIYSRLIAAGYSIFAAAFLYYKDYCSTRKNTVNNLHCTALLINLREANVILNYNTIMHVVLECCFIYSLCLFYLIDIVFTMYIFKEGFYNENMQELGIIGYSLCYE